MKTPSFIEESMYLPVEHSDLSFPVAIGGLAAFAAADANSSYPKWRDTVPDPLDLLDHFGNIGPSLCAGTITGVAITIGAAIVEDSGLKLGEKVNSPGKLKAALIGSGLLVGVVINAVAESKYGTIFTDDKFDTRNTVDFLDWILGTSATVIGSRFVNRFRRSGY